VTPVPVDVLLLGVQVYAAPDRQKEAFMGSRLFPKIPCILCSKPVDLGIDLCADENGNALHEECYVQRITSSSSNPAAAMMAD